MTTQGSEWQSNFLGMPAVDPRRELARLAVQTYDELCEAFDQQVCRHRNERGVAIPTSSYEAAMINRNAREVMESLLEQYGLTHKEFHDALRLVRMESAEPRRGCDVCGRTLCGSDLNRCAACCEDRY